MTPTPLVGRLVADLYGETTVIDTPTAAGADSARRRKLWEVEEKLHCPIIGTCVPLEELLRFARRFRFSSSLKDEFGLHVEAVQCSMSRNEVALTLHRHLERKYALAIRQFDLARGDADVLALWKQRLAAGDVAGPLWAALTHRAASAATCQQIYADIHMLSHQVGAGQAADSQRLTFLERECGRLRRELDNERKERVIAETVFRERVRQLEAELIRQQAELAAVPRLRAQLESFESGEVMVDLGRRLMSLQAANEQMRLESQRSRDLDAVLDAQRAQAELLRRERDMLAEERDALERMLLPADTQPEPCSEQCAGCDQAAAAGRCVLCVGGRTALLAQYRALAERLKIRFVHHDGGNEEALSRLPDLIAGADAVLCPTDCVSHAAYYQVKRHCKRRGKPCLLFKGAGISSFAVALTRISHGEPGLSLAGGKDLQGSPVNHQV